MIIELYDDFKPLDDNNDLIGHSQIPLNQLTSR